GDGWCGAESMLEFASILGCTRFEFVPRVQKEQRASTEKVEKSIFIFLEITVTGTIWVDPLWK
ncbi:MAG: hypothetical protein OXH93_12175, partial [Caldilineaceae bacterium]|nr:hypothetical protein [Caldilineaceae bacterium]